MRQSERAVIELRQGDPVYVSDENGGVLALAVEAAHDDTLRQLTALVAGSAELALSAQRARVLGLGAEDGIALALAADERPERLLELAAAPIPANARQRGRSRVHELSTPQRAALALGKAGRLLPAMITVRVGKELPVDLSRELARQHVLSVSAREALALTAGGGVQLRRVSQARVPLADSEEARFVLFREGTGVLEHIAILIGNRREWPDPVPVRLHSACLTGDLFGSLRCDCGEQLRSGVASIAARGGGALLYLAQEGRGIGLANKLRAYTLQDGGLDTVDADRTLGFGDDERRYDVAISMLEALDIDRISLLTNNPEKIDALRAGGIEVVAREALHGSLTDHNRRYLSAKAERAGHWLAEMLEPPAAKDRETGT